MQSRATVPQVPAAPILFPTFSPLHAPETISQEELGLLLSLRGRLKQLQGQIETEEESLKARLSAGAVVEPGDHFAEMKEHSRRNVAWKAVVIRLAVVSDNSQQSINQKRREGKLTMQKKGCAGLLEVDYVGTTRGYQFSVPKSVQ